MTSYYKKILLISFIISASHSWAGTMGLAPSAINYGGFYVGGMAGVSDLSTKFEYMINPGSAQIGEIGFIGGLFVGYNFIFFNDYNVEIEGFGNGLGGLRGSITTTTLPNVTCTSSGLTTTVNYNAPSSSTVTFSTPYNAGVRILPGYQIQNGGQFHLIAGWQYSSFTVNDNGSHGYINKSFSGSGFETGAGWETPLLDPLLLRIDLLYTMFGTYDVVGRGLSGTTASTQTYQVTPTPLSGVISLIYRP